MFLIQCESAKKKEAIIESVTNGDFKNIKTGKRFPKFKWETEKKYEVYKLRVKDLDEILGLMSLIYLKDEKWIKINLLQSSIENVGPTKQYDRIAGCLIAYACRLAFINGFGGCVALQPKTELVQHYINKYNFKISGRHLYTELRDSEKLIQEYLKEI